MDRSGFMRRAIDLSRAGMERGAGGPFGAVIVRGGRIVAEGVNEVTSTNDPTAHAEIVAIRRACQALHAFSLEDCEIYCSCEPCPMCLAAIHWARLDRAFYAALRADAAAAGFDDDRLYREIELPLDRRTLPMIPLLGEEARPVLEAWALKGDKIPY